MRPPSFIIFQLSKVHAGCSKHKQQRHHHWEPVQNRDRISPWFQFLSLIAFLGFQGNPFDIVFIKHGMGNGTNLDRHEVFLDFNDGDVFFLGCINGIRNDFLHLFAAANDRDTRFLYNSDDLPQ